MSQLNDNGTLTIEAYSFAEFLTDFQEAVLNGFYLDLDTNEYYPQKYGSHLAVTLVPSQWLVTSDETEEVVEADTKPVAEEITEVVTENKPAAKSPGRPRKTPEVAT